MDSWLYIVQAAVVGRAAYIPCESLVVKADKDRKER